MSDCQASCSDCHALQLLLEEKNVYIKKIEEQIQNLKATLHNYKTKACDICFCKINSEKNTPETCETQISKFACISAKNTDISPNNKNDFINSDLNSTFEESTTNDEIKENKEQLQELDSVTKEQNSSSEYVYDENYKMFYCVSTGYYYDRKTGLYYVPQNGAYYIYDYSENAYVLYSEESSTTTSNNVVTDAEKLKSGNDEGNNTLEKEKEKKTADFCESVLKQVNNLKIHDAPDSQAISEEPNFDDACNYEKKADVNSEFNDSETCSKDWQTPAGTNLTVQDLVREVAEQQSGMSDYVYDENSQMYFSQSTGYYYDSVRNLLYDPQSGIYYKYDSETGTYEFFHQVDLTNTSSQNYPLKEEQNENKKIRARRRFWRKKQVETQKICSLPEEAKINNDEKNKDNDEDENYSSPEEGEIFTSDSEEEIKSQPEHFPYLESGLSKRSPCIRAIVKNSEKLKIGTLILITCTGAIIGRDKSNSVFIPDLGVSKAHAEVSFNNEIWKYSIKDLGSQNGTFVNETRLSQSKEESQPCILNHGDNISVGSCKLALHIHVGYETCDDCEPGQIMADITSQENKSTSAVKTKEEKEKDRRRMMRQLKKKYGLEGMNYEEKHGLTNENSGYEDKADIRRKTVGSDNPYEKVESTSLERSMDESNKGYQMLKKLGWKEGDSLGTTGAGISEPIPLRPWLSKAGFGSSELQQSSMQNLSEDKNKRKWIKAQERFQLLS